MGERERERERERDTHTGRDLLFVLCNNVHTLMTNGITPIHHTPICLFNILSFFLSFFYFTVLYPENQFRCDLSNTWTKATNVF